MFIPTAQVRGDGDFRNLPQVTQSVTGRVLCAPERPSSPTAPHQHRLFFLSAKLGSSPLVSDILPDPHCVQRRSDIFKAAHFNFF